MNTPTPTPTKAAPTVIPIPAGTDIAPILRSVKPNTTLLSAPGAAIKCGSSVVVSAADVTVDGNGGTLTVAPSVGASSIIETLGGSYFTLKNFTSVTGSPASVIVNNQAPYTTVTNVKSVKGVLQFIICQNGGHFATIANNETISTNSYSVLCVGVHNIAIKGNTFGSSAGEATIRTAAVTNPNGSLTRCSNIEISGNHVTDHNTPGKQPIEIRQCDLCDVSENTIDGQGIRLGEPQATTISDRCVSVNVSGNTFVNCTTNAVQIYGGVTGTISNNITQPTASSSSMVAVAKMNSVVISGNIAEYLPGTAVKPVVAPTSDPASYHASSTNATLVVTLATTVIPALSYSAVSPGIQSVPLASEKLGPPTSIGYCKTSTWASYAYIDFLTGVSTATINLGCQNSSSGHTITLRLDSITGPIIGTLKVAGTGANSADWYKYSPQSTPVSGATGVRTLFLCFDAGTSGQGVANVESIVFK